MGSMQQGEPQGMGSMQQGEPGQHAGHVAKTVFAYGMRRKRL
jgi:hypothetical protein